MRIIRNRFIPFGQYTAINLMGIMFVKPHVAITRRLVTHESIHTQQMRELLYLPFYIIYIAEWLYHLLRTGNPVKAYHAISFEKEAYQNDHNPNYLHTRKHFAQWR